MKRIFVAVALTALTTPAFAQYFGGLGGTNMFQQQKQQATSGASAGGNVTSIVQEASKIPETTTLRNTPSIALGGPASGPCNGFSGGAGAGWAGFGATLNFSKVDEGCEERETARIAALMGRMDVANMVLEEMDVVRRAQERRANRQPKPAATPAKTSEFTPAQPQLVAASTMITPSEQARAVCDHARLTGDNILASRLSCPK